MTQTEEPIIVRVLRPEEGHLLTQAAEDIPLLSRDLADAVYLGATDSPDNYREITLAEAEQIRALQQKALDELAGESVEG